MNIYNSTEAFTSVARRTAEKVQELKNQFLLYELTMEEEGRKRGQRTRRQKINV